MYVVKILNWRGFKKCSPIHREHLLRLSAFFNYETNHKNDIIKQMVSRDIIIWDKETLSCIIIDISAPQDLNIEKKIQDRGNDYMLLVAELQKLYPAYKYAIVPVIIRVFGIVGSPTNLKKTYRCWDSVELKAIK